MLGWGAQLWSARELDLATPWRRDGPMLPLEYARFSRSGALALCLLEGAPEQRALWAVSARESVDAAVEDMRVRERAPDRDGVGLWRPGDAAPDGAAAAIAAWADSRGLDAVVWPGLPPRDPPPSADEVIELIRGMHPSDQRHLREHFERAPEDIRTPLRQRVFAAFGWSVQPLPVGTVVD